MRRHFKWILIFSFLGFGGLSPAVGQTSDEQISVVSQCSAAPKSGKRGKEVLQGQAFFILAGLLENQGKGKIAPEYDAPQSTCVIEAFDAGGATVTSYYSPWEKGMQTLHYSFVVAGVEGIRQFQVLYNGFLAFTMGKGFYFYVAEITDNETYFYAIYKNQPNYKTLKKKIIAIIEGKSAPLVGVTWPEDSEELLINGYDTKRLK